MKNGWHVVCGLDAYVEDGKVVRGVFNKGFNTVTWFPYVRNRRDGGWDNASRELTVDAFRARVRRGTAMWAH